MSSSANSSQPQDREHNASSSPVLTAKLAETLASTTLSQHMSSHKADAKSEDEIHDKEEVISPHTDVLSKIKDGPEVNSFDSSDPSSHVAKGASAASNRTESYPRAESKASDAKCSLDFEAEMKAIPAEGTPEFYDWLAPHYAFSPDQVARAEWMKTLIKDNKTWIGLDQTQGGIKVLDYAAGTGFLSHALSPYVTQILAIDFSRKMAAEYNEQAKESRSAHPNCEMRAIWSDMIKIVPRQKGLSTEAWDSEGEFRDFDMIAMSLAIDFFRRPGGDEDYETRIALKHALKTLAARLKDDGEFLIIDIETIDENSKPGPHDKLNGKLCNAHKVVGYGSKDVVAVLRELGFEDIEIKGNNHLRAEVEMFGYPYVREEVYFMVKAGKRNKKGNLTADVGE